MNKTTIAIAIVMISTICAYTVVPAYAISHHILKNIQHHLRDKGVYEIGYGIEAIFIDPDMKR